MANGQITDSKWPTCLSANPGDQAANLARPSHLNPRLARQAPQPDPAPGGVEVSPLLAVPLDGGNRGGGRVAQDQHPDGRLTAATRRLCSTLEATPKPTVPKCAGLFPASIRCPCSSQARGVARASH